MTDILLGAVVGFLVFQLGFWTARRHMEAVSRRAYISGLTQGAQAVADAVNAEAGFEKVDLSAVPPSAEVEAENRRRSC